MEKIAIDLPELEPGWVWLTGAGPGDAGLLTLYAAHGLASADVVVYDALVGDAVLALARPGARLEYAGKRGGKASSSQADISGRLIQFARAGRRVLRLKGGDPFVFGRGAEEAARIPNVPTPGGGTTTLSSVAGFAHGPASGTSSTQDVGGVVQLVAPTLVLSNLSGLQAFPIYSVLTLHFVPEPGTLALFGMGIAGVGIAGRWHRGGCKPPR